MRNEERVLMDVPMPIAGAGVVPTVVPGAEHAERRRPTTPLVFEAVERRGRRTSRRRVWT